MHGPTVNLEQLDKQVKNKQEQVESFDSERVFNSIFSVEDGNSEKLISIIVNGVVEAIKTEFDDVNVVTTSEIQDMTITVLGKMGYNELLYAYENSTCESPVEPLIAQENRGTWSSAAMEVMKHRYLKRDNKGNVIETPEGMFWRVARNIAQAELNYDESINVEEKAKEFYDMIINKEFLPNSPTLMNAGGTLQMLVACFVIPVVDDMAGILDAAKAQDMIQKSGGGTGMSFGDIRPKGDYVGSTQGVSSGPVSFMQLYDAVTNTIKQGGKRRGANMGVLPISHPDILDFIVCKLPNDKLGYKPLENFNISVAVTDDFMERVRNSDTFELVNPRNNEVTAVVDARDLFGKLVYSAWATGDPGILFIDKINEDNFLPHLGDIKCTNPCVTGDTWVVTSDGPKQVKNIIDQPINILMDGKFYYSRRGFFSSGIKKVYNVITDDGYELTATKEHPILSVVDKSKNTTEWREVGDLSSGDLIKLSNNRGVSWDGNGTMDEGYLLGLLVGDGTLTNGKAIISVWGDNPGDIAMRKEAEAIINKMPHRSDFNGFGHIAERLEYRMKPQSLKRLATEYGLSNDAKNITPEIEQTSSDFHIGFLRGLFDADGTVVGKKKNGRTVRLSQSNMDILKAAQRMLSRLGIASKIYGDRKKAESKLLPAGSYLKDGAKQYYDCKATHELIISKDNMEIFYNKIKFTHIDKQNKLKDKLDSYVRGPVNEGFTATILDVIPLDKEEVYDIQVEEVHRFDANGIVASNCGEQSLHSWDACNLGSINLAEHLNVDEDSNYSIDWDKLDTTVAKAMNFLDNVIDMSQFPVQEIDDMVRKNRRVGLGIMGWHDVLICLEIPYASDQAIATAEKIMEFIADKSREYSSELAEKRGNFPHYDLSLMSDLFGDIPMRNSYVNTIAPTGTIGIIGGPIASGCEPYFAIAWQRKSMLTEEGVDFVEVNPLFEQVAKREGFYSDNILEKVIENGSVTGIDEIPLKWQQIFACSLDIPYEWHIKMQAAFQKYIDNSISKTINMSNSAEIVDVEKSFFLAWELGCKGITIYRDGSKDWQVLNIKVTESSADKNDNAEGSNQLSDLIKSSGGCATCESV